MVEQNIDLAVRLVDRVAVMKIGQIVFERERDARGIKEEWLTQLAP